MSTERPDLFNYITKRKFNNKKNQDYSYEGLDERHEEYNKRGMTFQNVKSKEDLLLSFKIVDS